MKKYFPYILIMIIVVGILLPTKVTHAQAAEVVSTIFDFFKSGADAVIKPILQFIGFTIITILTFFVNTAGAILDYTINHTILDMSAFINGGKGVTGTDYAGISGINVAWKIIRDLMNITFIFILVYEGIKLILNIETGLDSVKKFIFGVVLASLLINFSLFFTKVLIDASNIVTTGIYYTIIGTPPTNTLLNYGISNKITGITKITTIFGGADLNPSFGDSSGQVLISIFGMGGILVVCIFIFLAMTVMLVIRFVAILFLLMLSPVAYMGLALPSMRSYASKWWESLKGQLLFPPIFFVMLLIVIKLMSSPGFLLDTNGGNFSEITSGKVPSDSWFGLIFNFVITIGLLIAALIVSKDAANKGSSYIGSATKSLGAFAGSAAFGATGFAGRKVFGGIGNKIASNADLQEAASSGRGFSGAMASAGLYTARTARDATFDARNASIPTSVIGDVTRGTIGRTGAGRFLGLDNAQTSSIDVGAPLSGVTGFGKGGTKGYREESAASEKEKRDRETANLNDLTIARARKDVLTGSEPGATEAEIDAMEKALAKLTEKQTLSLIEENDKLLSSQNFANKISVKTLEAIEKSDKFTDQDKSNLKTNRFKDIGALYDTAALAAYAAATAVPAAARTQTQKNDIKKIDTAKGRVKGLSDSELEMMDPTTHLSKSEVISELRPAQFSAIAKSSKFTSTQKKDIKDRRLSPLLDALDTARTPSATSAGYSPDPGLVRKMITKGLTAEDVSGLMGTNATFINHTGASVTESILLHPEILSNYNPKMLKLMADKMNIGDVEAIRDAIINTNTRPPAYLTAAQVSQIGRLATWLGTDDGKNNFA